MRRDALLPLAAIAAAGTIASCSGTPVDAKAATRNAPVVSELTARKNAGGDNEGPLGFEAPVSRSYLYEELAGKGIRAEALGPMSNWVKGDHERLISVMKTFAKSLGVECTWCHVKGNFAQDTPRKAVAQYMWDKLVVPLEHKSGAAVYCDSCHHGTTIYLDRSVAAKTDLLGYMKEEFVEQLKRRDNQSHGCATCHGEPINPRFLPRESIPEGLHPPPAAPGPQD